jgi:cathepsin D
LIQNFSDLWVAGSSCGTACGTSATFDPSTSSSFQNLSSPFDIQYGSGAAEGYVGQDVVQMAGFSVSNQGFGQNPLIDRPARRFLTQITAVVDAVTQGLLTSPVSGLLGLAWNTIAQSSQTPLWQSLAAGGAWDSALFAVQLTR